jgi:hypothetical protein
VAVAVPDVVRVAADAVTVAVREPLPKDGVVEGVGAGVAETVTVLVRVADAEPVGGGTAVALPVPGREADTVAVDDAADSVWDTVTVPALRLALGEREVDMDCDAAVRVAVAADIVVLSVSVIDVEAEREGVVGTDEDPDRLWLPLCDTVRVREPERLGVFVPTSGGAGVAGYRARQSETTPAIPRITLLLRSAMYNPPVRASSAAPMGTLKRALVGVVALSTRPLNDEWPAIGVGPTDEYSWLPKVMNITGTVKSAARAKTVNGDVRIAAFVPSTGEIRTTVPLTASKE